MPTSDELFGLEHIDEILALLKPALDAARFELNDQTTWKSLAAECMALLSRRGWRTRKPWHGEEAAAKLTWVKCDETTNSLETILRNECRILIHLVEIDPPAGEELRYALLTLVISPSGYSWAEEKKSVDPRDKRFDYIKCIRHTHADKRQMTWCGLPVSYDFVFESIDHAAYNSLDEGRLLICPKCSEAIREAILDGTYERPFVGTCGQ
jgi:hypothetical protein